jgi:hypothetical protein
MYSLACFASVPHPPLHSYTASTVTVLHLRLVTMATTSLQFNIVDYFYNPVIGNKVLSCYLPSLPSPIDIPYLSPVFLCQFHKLLIINNLVLHSSNLID